MQKREIIDQTQTPDGQPLELAKEAGHWVIRVAGVPLMSSAVHGSEEAMAEVASSLLGKRKGGAPKQPKVLVGGLGMGFTLRATLDSFGADASVKVAELLPALVGYNRGPLSELAGAPLSDPRVKLFEGDVRRPLKDGGWDAVLMDVDNGPDAFTVNQNGSLYGREGAQLMARALRPGGVLIVWSAYTSRAYLKRLSGAGLKVHTESVRARGKIRKGSRHILFVGQKPL